MYQVIIVIHILLGLGIIGLILMQHGKGADAGATFGGGASGSVFGAQGAASFLSRTTAILATMFFITSLGLAFLNSHKNTTINDLMGTVTEEKDTPDVGLPAVDVSKTAPAPVSTPTPVPTENKEAPPQAPSVNDKPAAPTVAPSPPEQKADVPGQPSAQTPKPESAPVVEEKESELKPELKVPAEKPAKASGKKQK